MDKRPVLAIIPARGGSKGLPRKNLRPLLGLPLLAYSLRAGQASRLITDLIVSTDDEEIAAVARAYGGAAPFLRPPELATDTASSVDVALHALHFMEERHQKRYEAVLLLQPTTPLRQAQDIDGALQLLFDTAADTVISFCQVEGWHPYYMYTLDGDRARPLLDVPSQLKRRQDFPPVYWRNGAIYLTRRDVLAAQRSFYGPDLRAYLMPIERSASIDSQLDLEWAEFLLLRQQKKGEGG